jgi:hypothetical protein
LRWDVVGKLSKMGEKGRRGLVWKAGVEVLRFRDISIEQVVGRKVAERDFVRLRRLLRGRSEGRHNNIVVDRSRAVIRSREGR